MKTIQGCLNMASINDADKFPFNSQSHNLGEFFESEIFGFTYIQLNTLHGETFFLDVSNLISPATQLNNQTKNTLFINLIHFYKSKYCLNVLSGHALQVFDVNKTAEPKEVRFRGNTAKFL